MSRPRHSNAEIVRRLDFITRLLIRLLMLEQKEVEALMALEPEVQSLIDEVTRNSSLVGSLKTASDGMAARIAELEQQIANLPTDTPIDADDKQAIVDQIAALKATNDAISTAVPANTPSEGQA